MANRTEVVVLQHPRERNHPFGSARMLVDGLSRSQLRVATQQGARAALEPLPETARAALLYPHPDAVDLAEYDESQPLERLVLLDGTWPQARRLYRDNPWLGSLPHVRLNPPRPGRYLVREEPGPDCLSTLEAGVAALSILEGDGARFEGLIAVFDQMNAQQLARLDDVESAPRRRRPPQRRSRRVPEALRVPPERIVALYTETAERATRQDPSVPEALQWVARRLGTQQEMQLFLRPSRRGPTPHYLTRLGLGDEDLAPAEAAETWFAGLLRPGDVLVAWNQSTLALLPPGVRDGHPVVQLKAAYCNLRGGRCGSLEHVVEQEALPLDPSSVSGRAGPRLSAAAAMARWLASQPRSWLAQ